MPSVYLAMDRPSPEPGPLCCSGEQIDERSVNALVAPHTHVQRTSSTPITGDKEIATSIKTLQLKGCSDGQQKGSGDLREQLVSLD